jgi:hypothetical protein
MTTEPITERLGPHSNDRSARISSTIAANRAPARERRFLEQRNRGADHGVSREMPDQPPFSEREKAVGANRT